jgi:hypothetical protein
VIAAADLVAALTAAGYEPRSYNGRAMSERNCVAVDLADRPALFDLGARLALVVREEVDGPSIDAQGRGVVAYWRRVKWPPGLAEPDEGA